MLQEMPVMSSGGGGGLIESTETIPSTGKTYNYTMSSCIAITLEYQGTVYYAGYFLKDGTQRVIKNVNYPSQFVVSVSGNNVTITAASALYDISLYVMHD